MRTPLGLAVAAIGVVLLVVGINAADSFASDVSRFFTGEPTNRAVWFMIGGVAAIVVGLTTAFMPGKYLSRGSAL